MKPCISSDHLDPLLESFGFPPPSSVWVGRFFTKLIVWFSSLISGLGWEVFYQVNQIRVFTYISNITVNHFISLRFSSSVSHWVRRFFTNSIFISLFVFLFKLSHWIKKFLPITYSLIFWFCFPVSHWIRGFFINQSLLYYSHCSPGAKTIILRNLVFSLYLSIYRQEVFLTVP